MYKQLSRLEREARAENIMFFQNYNKPISKSSKVLRQACWYTDIDPPFILQILKNGPTIDHKSKITIIEYILKHPTNNKSVCLLWYLVMDRHPSLKFNLLNFTIVQSVLQNYPNSISYLVNNNPLIVLVSDILQLR